MATIAENGLTLLRAMIYDLKLSTTDLVEDEFMTITGFDKVSSEQAITYLVQSGYLARYGGREFSLTAAGVRYTESALAGRLPLPITAERILRFIVETQRQRGQRASRGRIEAALSIDTDTYAQACQILIDYDLIECKIEQGIFELITATQKGKQAVHDNFNRPDRPQTSITAGAYIEQMSGGNLQSIANAYDSHIQQIVNHNDADTLRKGIAEALEKLVAEVSSQLDMQQRALYIQAAANLQQAANQQLPDKTMMEKALKVLTFGDSLGGTLELGEKTFTAIALAAPYVGIIAHAVERLVQSLPGS